MRKPSGCSSRCEMHPEGSRFLLVSRFPFPVSRQLLFPIPEFFQHAGKATDIAAERLEEFLVCPLDEMDELTREAATGGGWA